MRAQLLTSQMKSSAGTNLNYMTMKCTLSFVTYSVEHYNQVSRPTTVTATVAISSY
jgi:hypothetical protein